MFYPAVPGLCNGAAMISKAGCRALDDELVEVDAELRRWGDWAVKDCLNLGWPKTSLSGRMVEWNRLGIRPDAIGPVSIEIPEPIVRMDRMIAQLPDVQRAVVSVHYTSDEPFEVKCRITRTPRSSYYRLLDRARHALRFGLKLRS